jgi:hypothetical protein
MMTSLSQVNEMLLLRFSFLMLVAFGGTGAMAETDGASDYPTQTRAEYVFACMASNGQTQEALRQCSCSIDVIASILPYDKYEQAETVLRMRRSGGGYLGEMFRAATASNMVRDLEEAQAEGEIRCF